MIDKFVFWFNKNRTSLGVTIAGINILGGIVSVINDSTILAIFQFVVAIFILLDIRTKK